MKLPYQAAGATIIAEERWHGLLWSAVPQRVIASTPEQLVTYVPTGTMATRASSRGLPGTDHLTRDERKKLTLRTRQARVAELPEAPDKLFIYRPDRWSRINLGWDPATGDFRGWYVNFELPPQPTAHGLVSMDLVLDLWVNPDRTWAWKDVDDYNELLSDHTLDDSIANAIEDETEAVVAELENEAGPFSPEWLRFEAEPSWPTPELIATHTVRGSAWSFPPLD